MKLKSIGSLLLILSLCSAQVDFAESEEDYYSEEEAHEITLDNLIRNKEFNSIESEEDAVLQTAYNQENPVFEVELLEGEEEADIQGLYEYGYGFWAKWLWSNPVLLPRKSQQHQLGRLSQARDNQPQFSEKSITLATFVNIGSYQFSTHTISPEYRAEKQNIEYGDQFDGHWNYIYFSYTKIKDTEEGIAKGFVLFGVKNSKEVTFDVLHDYFNDYLHFVIKPEKKYPLFNGELCQIHFRYGESSFIPNTQTFVLFVQQEASLPLDLQKISNDRIMIQQVDDEVDTTQLSEPIQPQEFKGTEGYTEYSVSGWLKWIDLPKNLPWHTVMRLSQLQQQDIQNLANAGDRTLSLFKGNGFYHFSTYTTNGENEQNLTLCKNIPFDNYLHYAWTYVYFGYSKTLHKATMFVKYVTRQHLENLDDIHHFYSKQFSLYLQNDPWNPPFNGKLKKWVVNLGFGSYLQSGIDEHESNKFNFGYTSGIQKDIYQKWQPEKQTYDVGQEILHLSVELQQSDEVQINGILQYGFGFWSRFLFNGLEDKIKIQPEWLSLARLTINKDYSKDYQKPGDRTLNILLNKKFYNFATYSISPAKNNIISNIPYEFIDAEWNYIYFSYGQFEETKGITTGYVNFQGTKIVETDFQQDILHFPLRDYLFFIVGSSGEQLSKVYQNFNGQISKVQLLFGKNAFVKMTTDQIIKVNVPIPEEVPIVFEQLVFDGIQESKQENNDIIPIEFEDEFTGSTEYSLSLWFRWETTKRTPWETIALMSYNEPSERNNHLQPGDRVLSMYQYMNGNIFFSSYSINQNSEFAKIFDQCKIQVSDQNTWNYAYLAYSKQSGHIVSHLETPSDICSQKLDALHYVPNYMGLYIGNDGYHTPFNGKLAYVRVKSGNGSYREDNFKQESTYLLGFTKLLPKPIVWTIDDILLSDWKGQESIVEQEFGTEEFIIDSQYTYAYGYWARYLTNIPTRMQEKPQWMQMSRLTTNKDYFDAKNPGDRTLTILLGRGFYLFSTYNLNQNLPNVVNKLKYQDSLEGVWNFIYFSYSYAEQQASGYVKFGDTDQILPALFKDVQHKPLIDYALFKIGAEYDYPAFNGQYQYIKVNFGGNVFINDEESINKLIQWTFIKPKQIVKDAQIALVINEQVKVEDEIQLFHEWEEYEEVSEYAIYGWFKFEPQNKQPANIILLRLTENKQEELQDQHQIGDRTLIVVLQGNNYTFATYNLGQIDTGVQLNLKQSISSGVNLGLWTYVWFGYKSIQNIANGLISFPSQVKILQFDQIKHMIPRYFGLFICQDKLLSNFYGHVSNVGANFGKGAFQDVTQSNILDLLPFISDVNQFPIGSWRETDPNNYLHYSPAPESEDPIQAVYNLEFEEEADGATEYSFGLWTRWLMTIPTLLEKKKQWHTIVRLSTTQLHEDQTRAGNRCLNTMLSKGFYQFSTYDTISGNNNIGQNIQYGENLENQWNYIHFSYKSLNIQKAVGFVVFGNKIDDNIQQIDFDHIVHLPMLFARITVGAKEFAYQPFNGIIYDLQVTYGKGYIDNKDALQELLSSRPKPKQQPTPFKKQSILADSTEFTNDGTSAIQEQYEQFAGNTQYAVSGWCRFATIYKQHAEVVIYRLTTNSPEILDDNERPGDRTLSFFQEIDQFVASTYNYKNLDNINESQNQVDQHYPYQKNTGEWIYLYYGYDWDQKKTFSFVQFQSRSDENEQSEIRHYLPNQFWLYLGNDNMKTPFEGTLSSWNFYVGQGAFTKTPIDLVSKFPYKKITPLLFLQKQNIHKLDQNDSNDQDQENL